MRKLLAFSATLVISALPWQVNASTFDFGFIGPGVAGTLELTYGTASDAKYMNQGFEVTNVTGTFTDTNNGLTLVNVPIVGLEPINHATPEMGNTLAPADFSKFPVATGLTHGSLSYDNLFWPGGAPQTANSYPFSGGIVDIYGLMFDIGNSTVVNFWSNGDMGSGPDYGVAVATHDMALDYTGGGVAITPEPGTLALLGSGFAGLLLWRRRRVKA